MLSECLQRAFNGGGDDGSITHEGMGEGGDAVRVGLGSVWLSNGRAQTAWRIDPKRAEATMPEF